MNSYNTTVIACENGTSNIAEFSVLDVCHVSILWDSMLRILVVSSAYLAVISQVVYSIYNRKYINKKKGIPKAVLVWSIFQNLIMSLRPLIGLLTGLRSSNSLFMEYITHISGASAAAILISFIYIQARLMHKSSLIKSDSFLLENKLKILGITTIIEVILFLIGPLLTFYFTRYFVFWIVVVIVDFTEIPYFCFLGISIYLLIKQQDRFQKLARQIIITISICSIMGLFTGVVGIAACIGIEKNGWILVELCWESDIVVNTAIFSILIRNRKKEVIVNLSSKVSEKLSTIEIQ